MVGWQTKGKAREAQQNAIANGEVSIIIGTHAIFQEQVKFHSLALVIIDEQHRFWSTSTPCIMEKRRRARLSSTPIGDDRNPIPRTLAMTAYADMDTSIIDELPPGRTPVTTVAIPDTRRNDIIERIRVACSEENRQAYWVCTLIEDSEVLEAQAAQVIYDELTIALPEIKDWIGSWSNEAGRKTGGDGRL